MCNLKAVADNDDKFKSKERKINKKEKKVVSQIISNSRANLLNLLLKRKNKAKVERAANSRLIIQTVFIR